MVVSADGDLAVRDVGNVRITIFPHDGPVRTYRAPEGKPGYTDDGLTYHSDGSLWAAVNPPFTRESPVLRFPRPVYVRVAGGGRFVDTLFAPARLTHACPTLTEARYAVGFWNDEREPWIPVAQWSFGPDGTLVLGCPADYGFDVLREGQVMRVERAWEAAEASAEERKFLEAVVPLPSLPPRRPAYARIVVPGDGRIWVWPVVESEAWTVSGPLAQRSGYQAAWRPAQHGAFDVFRADGRWLGSVRMPPEVRYSGFPPTRTRRVVRGDTLWSVVFDSLDVQTVVRYRVRWPAN